MFKIDYSIFKQYIISQLSLQGNQRKEKKKLVGDEDIYNNHSSTDSDRIKKERYIDQLNLILNNKTILGSWYLKNWVIAVIVPLSGIHLTIHLNFMLDILIKDPFVVVTTGGQNTQGSLEQNKRNY